jgi:hypothetical protein
LATVTADRAAKDRAPAGPARVAVDRGAIAAHVDLAARAAPGALVASAVDRAADPVDRAVSAVATIAVARVGTVATCGGKTARGRWSCRR